MEEEEFGPVEIDSGGEPKLATEVKKGEREKTPEPGGAKQKRHFRQRMDVEPDKRGGWKKKEGGKGITGAKGRGGKKLGNMERDLRIRIHSKKKVEKRPNRAIAP